MNNDSHFKKIRKEYRLYSLSISNTKKLPIEQFKFWYKEAVEKNLSQPNAISLATINEALKPTLRMVLFKGLIDDAFTFYTNYESKKGKDIEKNKNVALLFFWDCLERQIRIEGSAQKISREESENYFNSRPKGAQISAIVSPQSDVISSREELEKKYKTAENNQNITCPENWGGYKVIPSYFEFWQGREGRLHDRIVYELEDNSWNKRRLAP